MEKLKLTAKTRNIFGRKTKQERKNGLIPAVLYGKGIKTLSLWINRLDFGKLVKQSGESTIIDLNLDEGESRNVLIYETQRDPVKGDFIHADFFQVRMDEEIETEVELVYVGESLAVKDLYGVLVRNMDSVEVKCFPADLPSHIDVDISPLKTFDDHIYAKDLKIPDRVKVDLDPETVVALVSPPRSEEELKDLEEKVEEDVTKVEGIVKEEKETEGKTGEEKNSGEKPVGEEAKKSVSPAGKDKLAKK